MEENKEAVMMEMQETELTEMISINVICRLCANQNDKLIGIYSEDGIHNDLANKMNLYLPIKVNETDELPLQCCWQCASTVLAWHELVITSAEADRRLRSYQFVSEKQLEINFQSDRTTEVEKANELFNTDDVNETKGLIFYDNISDDEGQPSENIAPSILTKSTSSEEKNLEKTVSGSQTLLESQEAINVETNTCNLCSENFPSSAFLTNHMNKIHQLKKPKHRRKKSEIDATFVCPTCNKGFTRKFDMQKHILNKHPNKKNEVIPSKRAKNLEILEKCKLGSHEGDYYKCDICEQKFIKGQSLLRHRNIHVSERLYCCHICGKKFLVSNALLRHINRLHYGIKNFICDICGKTFTNKTTRDEHINIHTNNRPFVCDICGKSFKQNSSLHIHKMFHTNIFRFSCNICNKKFRRKQDLKVHHWMHTGEKPHQCTVCKISFRLGQDLKRHLKIHAEYFCDECGLKFDQERFLNMHKKVH